VTFILPTRGQIDWDDEINGSLLHVKESAENAAASATAAQTTANTASTNASAAQAEIAGRLSAASLVSTFAPDVIFVGAGIDPTGVADSTAAIQTIINANPGRRLRFPVGVFKFSTLTLTDGQSLVGSGWQDYRDRHVFFGEAAWNTAASFHGTILRSTATTGVAITIFDNEVNTGNLAEFFLIGPGSGTSTGILLGGTIVTESIVHPVWDNVKVGNFSVGVKMQWLNEASINDLTIHGCTTGLLFGQFVNNNSFNMLDIQRCTTGFTTVDATCVANNFYGPIAQVCGNGFVLSGQKNVLHNPYIEGTTAGQYAIDIAGGVGNAVHAPLLSGVDDRVRIRAGANDTTVTAFGYDGNTATLTNAAARSYLQGYFTGLLTDTGTNTIVVDAAYAGSAFAARKAWTPTFDAAYGGGFVLGNGTVTGRYSVIGKNVIGHVEFIKGSSSVMSGQIRLLLPISALSIASIQSKVTMLMANGNFVGSSLSDAVSNVIIAVLGTNGASVGLTASVPAVWNDGDKITVQFAYEIA
jgi:hypothetical protein